MPCLLYCVTQPGPEVKVSTGVAESAVRSREMLGVRLYWSEIPDPETTLGEPETLKKAALEFHQVLREVLAVTTPIPFRFPTLLENEEAIEPSLSAEQELYRDALARVAIRCNTKSSAPGPTTGKRILDPGERSRVPAAAATGRSPRLRRRDQAEDRNWRLRPRMARPAGAENSSLVCLGAARKSRALSGGVANGRRVGRHSLAAERAVAAQRVRHAAR